MRPLDMWYVRLLNLCIALLQALITYTLTFNRFEICYVTITNVLCKYS